MADEHRLQKALHTLSPRDIAALYYGYLSMLQDLQELQLSGTRVPGGLSGRVQIAGLYLNLLDDALRDLRDTNPQEFRAIWEWLELSPNRAISRIAAEMKASVDRNAA